MKKLTCLGLFISLTAAAQQNYDFTRSPNSYIFDPVLAQAQSFGGLYIPVKKAYAMWSGFSYLKQGENFTPVPDGTPEATVFWEDVPGLIKSVSLEEGSTPEEARIKVDINRFLGNGNAVIAYKVNGTVYWSWHVWVSDDPSNGVTYSQGFEAAADTTPVTVQYMDRNLGALSNSFLGNNWQKSGGLLYEWGRKDPFPPLVYKDFFFYEIKSTLGYLKHNEISSSTIPVVERPSAEIAQNMRFAVQHPLHYVISKDNANWFSSKLHKKAGSGTDFEAWDLWADNYKGGNSNASSSNAEIRDDSRSYEKKSELDPCPNGWRVPSYYGRVTVNNNLGPFGRKNSGGNDDAQAPFNTLYPHEENSALSGIKVYPGLGMDFSAAQNGERNIGKMAISGNYEKYPNSASPNAPFGVMYQDENSDGGLWSATFGYDGGRLFGMVSDALSPLTEVGKHQVFVNQTNSSDTGNAVKCMRDPNIALIGDFPTQYFADSENAIAQGLDQPNSYLITTQQEILIPVSKPFAVQSQLFAVKEPAAHQHLKAKVLWTTNPNTVQSLEIINPTGNPIEGFIKVKIKPGQKGNFVISLHNGSTASEAYWSWFFWVPEGNPTQNSVKYLTEMPVAANANFVNPTKSFNPPLVTTLMDRNLGAVEAFRSSASTEFIRKTKGMLFQWGRKDAIPSFQQNGQEILYLGNDDVATGSPITYRTLHAADYLSQFSLAYPTYAGSEAGDKFSKAKENIRYSIAHPLTFLYQSGTGALFDGGKKTNNNLDEVRDWVSDERSVLSDRWGHGDKKSPFDPCPEGWRVPDVFGSTLYSGSKGNSPFYNGYQNDYTGKSGIIQDQWADIIQYYSGSTSIEGWLFTDSKYPLGSFSADGIRGELGENTYAAARSGVWTASLADLGTGYALAMLFDNKKMQTGTGVYPQAAMSVRCAKDEPRYLGLPVTTGNEPGGTLGTVGAEPAEKAALLFPNPFTDALHLYSDDAVAYQIFDLSGKMIAEGSIQNRKIPTATLLRGAYLVKLQMKDHSYITQKVLRK